MIDVKKSFKIRHKINFWSLKILEQFFGLLESQAKLTLILHTKSEVRIYSILINTGLVLVLIDIGLKDFQYSYQKRVPI